MPEKGYLYVAAGEQYLKEAEQSALSLKKVDHQAHITLITNENMIVPWADDIKVIESEELTDWKIGLTFKIRGLLASPYYSTFFIDADTHFFDTCRELFELLSYYDLCLAHSTVDTSEVIYKGKRLTGYLPYNTGVILYRKSENVDRLFNSWLQCYREKIDQYLHDQPALLEAMLQSSFKLYTLQNIYNARIPYPASFMGKKVKIAHGRHKNMRKLERKLNRYPDVRVWIPRWGRTISIFSSSRRLLRQLPPGWQECLSNMKKSFQRLLSRFK